MAKQSKAQQKTIERVMHEAKHGELKTARGRKKVTNPKQAIAIALHEAGASKQESPQKNRRNLSRTKAKERRGETYRDEAEGRGAKSSRGKTSRSRSSARTSPAKSSRKTGVKAAPRRSTATPAKRRARR